MALNAMLRGFAQAAPSPGYGAPDPIQPGSGGGLRQIFGQPAPAPGPAPGYGRPDPREMLGRFGMPGLEQYGAPDQPHANQQYGAPGPGYGAPDPRQQQPNMFGQGAQSFGYGSQGMGQQRQQSQWGNQGGGGQQYGGAPQYGGRPQNNMLASMGSNNFSRY